MHHDNKVMGNNLPEIIDFYNATKGGVDTLDKKTACYATGRRSRRWPLTIFYRLLDISVVNSEIIARYANADLKMPRFHFIKSVAKSLIQKHIASRAMIPNLRHDLRPLIRKIVEGESSTSSSPQPSTSNQATSKKRRRCYMCDSKSDRKYSTYCGKCSQTICKEHAEIQTLCKRCK